jgi:hypothetical protein
MMQSSRPFECGSSIGETECKQFHYNIDTAESPQVYASDLLANSWKGVGQHLANGLPIELQKYFFGVESFDTSGTYGEPCREFQLAMVAPLQPEVHQIMYVATNVNKQFFEH